MPLETGAVFVVIDKATSTLKLISDQFIKIDTLAKSVQTSLDKIAMPATLTAQLDKLLLSFKDVDAAAKVAGENMVKSFGASFAEIDKTASGSVLAIQSEFSKLDEAAKASGATVAGAFGSSFADIGAEAKTELSGVARRFGSIARSAGIAAGRVADLKIAMTNIPALPGIGGGGAGGGGAGTRLPGSGGGYGRARGGGGHGGDNGLHYRNEGIGVPGGGHVRGTGAGGIAALGGVVVMADAILEDAKLDDIIARALITGQIPVDQDMMKGKQAQLLREAIKKGASTTGFSNEEVGEAILGTERQFGGLDFETRMKVLGTLLPYAGGEARLKETGLKEAFESMIGLVHMSGTFKPEDMPALAKSFAFTSMMTSVPLPQFSKALSYSMPVLHAGLEMDPSTIMFLTAMMQNAGVTNTKSGTWLRSFFQKSEPDVAIPGHELTKTQIQHNDALQALGLTDKDGNVTWQEKGADGKVDWTKSVVDMAKNLGDKLKTLPVEERLAMMKKAFGEQGSGFASLMTLPQFTEQFPIIAEKMKTFKGGTDVLEQYTQGSTVQQARETWRDTQNVLVDIGQVALPTVNKMLREFDEIIKTIGGGNKQSIAKMVWDHVFGQDVGKPENWAKAGKAFNDTVGLTEKQQDHFLKLIDPKTAHELMPLPGDVVGQPAHPQSRDMWPGKSNPFTDTTNGDAGLLHLNSFVTGEGGDGPEDIIYRGTLRAFTDFANGTTLGGSGGGSGGSFINASYEGDGGGSGGGAHAPVHNIRYGLGGHTPDRGTLVDGSISKFGNFKTFDTKSPEVMKRLMADFNLDAPAAAKILGNLGHESAGFTAFNEGGNGPGRGWAQWTDPARKAGFYAYAEANHLDPKSDEANYGYLKHELSGAYKGAVDRLRNGGSLEGFEQSFEGAGVKAYGSRHAYEQRALQSYSRERQAPKPEQPIIIHHKTVLDGKIVAQNTMKHMASAGRFPTTMGGVSNHDHYSNPAGTPVNDVA